ncbi:hypothetical protein AALP_AA7G279000 [Arabis alpina]|uniref:Uncharacterized protein n=1 Tax=Arabis alpina TaxID=50452 RepID=A0A087GL18_ARAAL|nr:hypothetical protein AALP_AA7G279000 [Arabis alpina]
MSSSICFSSNRIFPFSSESNLQANRILHVDSSLFSHRSGAPTNGSVYISNLPLRTTETMTELCR